MRVSVSSPRGYLNWDMFLSSNFVMFSMYGLQLTTAKILDICIRRSSIHFQHQLIQPTISYMSATRQRQSSVTNVRLFTQQNIYDQYVYASFLNHQHTATMYKKE